MRVAFKGGGGYNTQHKCCISRKGLFTWLWRNQSMAVKTQTPNDTVSTDRIEKRVVLRAPRTRVWRALTNAEEFGAWFRVKLEGSFTEGRPVRGRLSIPGYEHVTLENPGRAHRPRAVLLVSLAPLRRRPRRGLLGRAHNAGRVPSRGNRRRHRAHDCRVRV